MKKIFLAFIICIATSFGAGAQTPPLNKQQTLDYITKLWKANFDTDDYSITSITLDGKIFRVKLSNGNAASFDLTKINASSLFIIQPRYAYCFSCYELHNKLEDGYGRIIWDIKTESEVIRLKKALLHLIELVKAEKSTDPFDD